MRETVVIDKKLAVPSEKAWAAITAIGGLDRWFPIIEACRVEGEGEGAIRVLTLRSGGEMRDVITKIDPGAKLLRYHRTHLPFPVSDYFGAVEIRADGAEKSRLTWTVEFEVGPEHRDEIAALIKSAISDGVDGMERQLRGE